MPLTLSPMEGGPQRILYFIHVWSRLLVILHISSSFGREPVRVIANFCSLPLFSFGHALGKLQEKVLKRSEKVG